jgi:hypothetical protein
MAWWSTAEPANSVLIVVSKPVCSSMRSFDIQARIIVSFTFCEAMRIVPL